MNQQLLERPEAQLRLNEATSPVRPQSSTEMTEVSPPVLRFQEELGLLGSAVPVEVVIASPEEGGLTFWTVLRRPDPPAHRKIYAIQKRLQRDFPEFSFDFYLIFRGERPLHEVLSSPLGSA